MEAAGGAGARPHGDIPEAAAGTGGGRAEPWSARGARPGVSATTLR